MKKIISLLLSLAVIGSLLSTAALGANFKDTSGNTWYSEGVEYCSSKGLISGYSDGTFRPSNSITRAELAAICSTGLKLSRQATNQFKDVKSGEWYTPYVLKCVQAGIITGYSSDKFGPNDRVTREQAAVIAVKVYGLSKTPGNTSFADNSQISSWAVSSVKSMTSSGLASGRGNNRFCPKDYVTRAEVAVVINTANKNGYKAAVNNSSNSNSNSNNNSNNNSSSNNSNNNNSGSKASYGVKSDGKTCYGTVDSSASSNVHTFKFTAKKSLVHGIKLTKMDTWTNYMDVNIYDSKGVRLNYGHLGTYYNVACESISFPCKAGETYTIEIHGYRDNYYEFVYMVSREPRTISLGYKYSGTFSFCGQKETLTFVAPENKRYGFRIDVESDDNSRPWVKASCVDSKGRHVFGDSVGHSTLSTLLPSDLFTAGETYTITLEYGPMTGESNYTFYMTE